MTNVKAFRLVYVNFASPNAEKLKDYYIRTMGYILTKEESGVTYLSNGFDHHNIIITPALEKKVLSYGYQLDGKLTHEEVQAELKEIGISSIVKTDAIPGVSELVELHDPDGNTVHIFNEIEHPAPGFGQSGIVPQKLGHLAFYAKDFKNVIKFYEDALGFMFSDQIGEDFANFLTCNTDHHVINIVASETKSQTLHHIAFQLKDASHHTISSDLLAKHGHPVIWGPSRHTSGHNIATYHYDPDGNVVELFTDMDVYVPELGIYEPRPWHEFLPLKPRVWDGLSAWGTEFEVDLANV
ncbi:VOC family protein [Bhargavaea ginsengi]|uniref:VOC family protein n=1 Tax=Bhargavaea ginsengi TaxID=426757 RepID=UPI00203ED9CA|nr:VOC family protein [Bhargavaea ginsengi]MCM3087526.1 VOC family protein [Bhargavaea ginsengi]